MSALDKILSAEDVKAMMAALMDKDPRDTGEVSEAHFRWRPCTVVYLR